MPLLCQGMPLLCQGMPLRFSLSRNLPVGEICFPAFTSQESIYQSGKSASRLEAFFGPDGLLDAARGNMYGQDDVICVARTM